MIEIPVSNGKYTTVIDDEDYGKVIRYKWYGFKKRNDVYVFTTVKREGRDRFLLLHRLILNAPKKLLVDHINRDTLDNRRANLRLATASQNLGNMRKKRNNTSGYTGVTYIKTGKRSKRWRAQITFNNRNIHLGDYLTKEEAARAYNVKATEIRGEYTYLNPNLPY